MNIFINKLYKINLVTNKQDEVYSENISSYKVTDKFIYLHNASNYFLYRMSIDGEENIVMPNLKLMI